MSQDENGGERSEMGVGGFAAANPAETED